MKNQLTMILFVVILGSIAAGILVGTKTLTEARISDNQEYALKSTILNAFDISYDKSNVLKVYDDNISKKEEGGKTFYYSKKGEIGFEFEGGGLWGPIRGFLTLEPDFETIKGIQIISHEETPGLGGVVSEQPYLNKYKGKKFDPKIIISKNADMSSDNEVDAITGATMTSNFFQIMLNKSYQESKEAVGQ